MENSKKTKRVFHLEDTPYWQNRVEKILSNLNCTVVNTYTTINSALLYIKNNRLANDKINIAVLDGNLPDGHGSIVAEKIRSTNSNITIIALSNMAQTFGDYNIHKKDIDKSLRSTIESIFEI